MLNELRFYNLPFLGTFAHIRQHIKQKKKKEEERNTTTKYQIVQEPDIYSNQDTNIKFNQKKQK